MTHVSDRNLEELVIGYMDRNSGQVVRFLDNPEVREFVTRLIRNRVYTSIQTDAGFAPPLPATPMAAKLNLISHSSQ